jgi:PAS domain S-box-containing protein
MVKAACDRRQAEALDKGQREVLEMIALGVPLNETLDVLLKLIESQAAGMKCSISTVDHDGLHLQHVSAPSLPAEFVGRFDGETIGEKASWSAAVAHLREPVVVTDIDVEERFEKYRELAQKHGLRACLSMPIFDPHHAVIGTLAVYYSEAQSPSPHHLRLIEVATNTAAVCISRKREEEALQASEVRYRTLFETAPNAVSVLDARLRLLMTNERAARLYGFDRTEDLIGLELLRFVALKDRARIKASLYGVLETGNLEVFECLGVRKDGTHFQVEIRATLLPNLEGKSPSLLAVKTDITKRKQAENALRNSEEQLRALTAKMRSTREEEGARIAREIHDELGGALTGLKWDLEAIDSRLAQANGAVELPEVRKRINSMTGLIESTINTVRRISSELRPGVLDDLGLVAAIEWQGQQFQARTGLEVHFETELEMAEVNREGATAVFRIFQEVLTNVLRHSQAKNIYISLLDHDDVIELEVRDDGRGITEREKGNTRSLGLLGMKERALLVGGNVTIRGASGHGTTVTVRVPKNYDAI